jgi:ABC-type multidrug transport system ATPase subunit
MKLLKVAFNGVDLFKGDNFEINFFASDRVVNQSSVHLIERPIYSQNIVAFAGINAVGKTSALRLLEMVLRILKDASLRTYSIPFEDQLREGFRLKVLFWSDGQYFLLESKARVLLDELEESMRGDRFKLVFLEEELWLADTSIRSRQQLSDFAASPESARLVVRRSELDAKTAQYLGDDISIVGPFAGSGPLSRQAIATLYGDALLGRLIPKQLEQSVFQAFDASIDYLTEPIDDELGLRLKFKTDTDERRVNPRDLSRLLSSGTMRGSVIIARAIRVLKTGGYLLVDEIENHLNKQLVGVILSLFDSDETNPLGATIIFTTHYPEVLDFVRRKDNVYFMIRDKSHKTEVICYSDRVKRIENKKSEVFLSNYIEGTAPKYSEVSALKHAIAHHVKADRDDR